MDVIFSKNSNLLNMKYKKDKKTLEDVRDILKNNGFILISEHYVANKKIEVMCRNGHLRKAYFYTLKNTKECSKCNPKKINTQKTEKITQSKFSNIVNLVSGMGFMCIKKNSNINDYIHLRCNKNHEFLIKPSTIYGYKSKNKHLCPICSGSFNEKEEECRKIFEELTGFKFFKQRPDWLQNPITGRNLELDGYCAELKIAFEYDTPDHLLKEVYTSVDGVVSKTKSSVSIRDSIKESKCIEMGVKLIRINSSTKDMRAYVTDKLKINGII